MTAFNLTILLVWNIVFYVVCFVHGGKAIRSCIRRSVINPFANNDALLRARMKTRPTFAVLAIAAIALTALGSIGTIVVVNTESAQNAQNTTAGAVDTSNVTKF